MAFAVFCFKLQLENTNEISLRKEVADKTHRLRSVISNLLTVAEGNLTYKYSYLYITGR